MVVATVIFGRVPHPTDRRMMVRKGYKLVLDPSYRQTRDLINLLQARGGWEITGEIPAEEAVVQTQTRQVEQTYPTEQLPEPVIDKLLPYHERLIQQMRSRRLAVTAAPEKP